MEKKLPDTLPVACLETYRSQKLRKAARLKTKSTTGLREVGVLGEFDSGKSAPYHCLTLSIGHWIDSMTPQERESFYSETLPPK